MNLHHTSIALGLRTETILELTRNGYLSYKYKNQKYYFSKKEVYAYGKQMRKGIAPHQIANFGKKALSKFFNSEYYDKHISFYISRKQLLKDIDVIVHLSNLLYKDSNDTHPYSISLPTGLVAIMNNPNPTLTHLKTYVRKLKLLGDD